MKSNTYIITKLKKDRSQRFILSTDLQTWLPFNTSHKHKIAYVTQTVAQGIIESSSIDKEHYYLKTSV